jgi:cytochrome c-type biogenesis protein CcmF
LRAFGRLISKNRRRYGGYIVHLGVVLVVIGITGSSVFVKQKEATLKTGESMSVGDFTLRFDDLNQYTTDAKHGTAASLSVFDGERKIGAMAPEKNLYKYSGNREINQETEVAILSSFTHDLYVILSNFQDGSASFRVLINPMVSWIWAGGVVLLLGAIVIMWPTPSKKEQEVLVSYSIGSKDRTAEV